MNRREFSAKIRDAAFTRASGRCESCGGQLYTGKYHYDHILPDTMGGEPTLDNCAVLCVACHGGKTKGEATTRSKADRQREFHIGIRKGSGFQTNRDGKFKKTFNNGTVLR